MPANGEGGGIYICIGIKILAVLNLPMCYYRNRVRIEKLGSNYG